MAQLRQDYDKFLELDAVVVAIGPESPGPFAAYFEENDLPFIGIPDPEHSVLRLYGQEIKLFKGGRMPAQVIIDKGGLIRYAHYGSGMSDIPSNQELLEILSELEKGRQ
jgi:peroxiredoxin Q/BCP